MVYKKVYGIRKRGNFPFFEKRKEGKIPFLDIKFEKGEIRIPYAYTLRYSRSWRKIRKFLILAHTRKACIRNAIYTPYL